MFKEALKLYVNHLLGGRREIAISSERRPLLQSDLVSTMELMMYPEFYVHDGVQRLLEFDKPLDEPIRGRYEGIEKLMAMRGGVNDSPEQKRANESAIVLLSTFVFGVPMPLNELNLQYPTRAQNERTSYGLPVERVRKSH